MGVDPAVVNWLCATVRSLQRRVDRLDSSKQVISLFEALQTEPPSATGHEASTLCPSRTSSSLQAPSAETSFPTPLGSPSTTCYYQAPSSRPSPPTSSPAQAPSVDTVLPSALASPSTTSSCQAPSSRPSPPTSKLCADAFSGPGPRREPRRPDPHPDERAQISGRDEGHAQTSSRSQESRRRNGTG